MQNRTILCLVILGLASFSAPLLAQPLDYEIRMPKSKSLDPGMRAFFQTDQRADISMLKSAKTREDGSYLVFMGSDMIFGFDKRYALIMEKNDNGPAQIFVFTIPMAVAPGNWSEWKKPDYVADKNAAWNFMNGKIPPDRAAQLPSDCFEVRYRIKAGPVLDTQG